MRKRADITMNSPLSIRPQRLLLQNVSPKVPVFGKNMNSLDFMKIYVAAAKEYDQMTVQEKADFDKAMMIITIINIIVFIIIVVFIIFFIYLSE